MKVLSYEKECIVLLYEAKDAEKIVSLVRNKRLYRITQKLHRKMCLIEVNEHRNREWMIKLNDVKQEWGKIRG